MFRIRLKQLREELGISQYQLAKDLTLAQSTIGMWESGKREPSFDTVKTLSSYFKVSTDYLLGKTTWKNLEERAALSPDEFAERMAEEKAIRQAKLTPEEWENKDSETTYDDKTMTIAHEISKNESLKTLFNVMKDTPPDKLKAYMNFFIEITDNNDEKK